MSVPDPIVGRIPEKHLREWAQDKELERLYPMVSRLLKEYENLRYRLVTISTSYMFSKAEVSRAKDPERLERYLTESTLAKLHAEIKPEWHRTYCNEYAHYPDAIQRYFVLTILKPFR